jgi:DNA helicase-2/ATP-dependent DNA helicase PcrA
MAIEISSESQIDINHHFRVSAGPGAGKTHWLSSHVSHVLKTSECLGKMGKVACLSYTNVGADTLMGRMYEDGNRVLSCTIHSFLYAYIVKPYLHFIAAEEGFNLELLTGEDDRILSDYNTFEEIKKTVKQFYAEQDATFSAIRAAKWRLQEDDSLKCYAIPPKRCCKEGYFLSENAYVVYKKLAWAKGYMHYDDVLYFSYKLILILLLWNRWKVWYIRLIWWFRYYRSWTSWIYPWWYSWKFTWSWYNWLSSWRNYYYTFFRIFIICFFHNKPPIFILKLPFYTMIK